MGMLLALVLMETATVLGAGGAGNSKSALLAGGAPAWLHALEAPAIAQELRQLANDDEAAAAGASPFAAQFGPNTDLAGGARGEDWQALPLMNKGHMLPGGCAVAPVTCAALSRLRAHLQPRPGSSEVGVRLLKLAPGGRLRPHRGPGGRLVAHLGVKIPAESFLMVDGQKVEWREGALTVFDDSALHSAANPSDRPRYILHVAFPAPAKLIGSTGTSHSRLDFFDDCSVVATSLRAPETSASDHQPLVQLYNKVADNRPTDFDSCVSATSLLPSVESSAGSTSTNGTLRITAAHGYGSVDINYYPGKDWVVFELSNLALWKADPVEKHIAFAVLCTKDICPNSLNYPPPSATGANCSEVTCGKIVGGKFQGWRGAEGSSATPFSSGFLTISSDWQFERNMVSSIRTCLRAAA